MEEFLKDLASMRWEFVGCEGQSVHESANFFNKQFEQCLDRHAPIKKIKIRPHYRRGLSEQTINLIKERNLARLRALRADDANRHVLAQKYKKARNAVTNRIRRESVLAIRESLMKSQTPSDYWKTVKALNPMDDEGMILEENGVRITDEKAIGDILNPFFKQKVEGIERDIPPTTTSPTGKLEESLEGRNLSFGLRTVTECQVEKAIKSLKNKSRIKSLLTEAPELKGSNQ